jgi:hypothetical protein
MTDMWWHWIKKINKEKTKKEREKAREKFFHAHHTFTEIMTKVQ